MTTITRQQFINIKRDYSELLIHLTKANSGANLSALEVLAKIINDRCLKPFNPLGLFGPIIKKSAEKIPEKIVSGFNSISFSECPLEFISTLVAPVSGRGVKLEPYGIALAKDFVRDKGGNPVFYCNRKLQKVYYYIWNLLSEQGQWNNLAKFIPLIDKSDSERDFHWEREWRIQNELQFALKDIAYVICPDYKHDSLSELVEKTTLGYEEEDWVFLPKIDPYRSEEHTSELQS